DSRHIFCGHYEADQSILLLGRAAGFAGVASPLRPARLAAAIAVVGFWRAAVCAGGEAEAGHGARPALRKGVTVGGVGSGSRRSAMSRRRRAAVSPAPDVSWVAKFTSEAVARAMLAA